MKMPKFGKIGRYAVCILLVLAIFLGYEIRLFQWQIVEGDKYEQISLSNRTDTIELDAARGEILDSKGNVLSGNKTSFDIVYNALDMVREERNATIIKVIDLLEERGEKWVDRLPIVQDEDGNYQFAENAESEIETLKSQDMLNMAEYATADDCIAELAREYGCEGYSKKDTRDVASVRYSMTRDAFSRTNPYVIAKDVSAETVGIISERADELKGIEPAPSVTRYYGEDGALAPHVVGYAGLIQDTQYDRAVENGTAYDPDTNISGYKWVDTIGIDGIEAAFEEDLRGKRGEKTIFTDESGGVKNTSVTTQPQEGNTVHLTLDSDLQRAANFSLEKNILGNTDAKNCTSGAAVVLDVKNFGVLASASYPDYDLNLYTTDVKYSDQINGDEERKPMFNRALQGEYVPGSVFKPMVALAALQEQVISAGTTYFCDKVFRYADMELGCTGYHGNADLYTALSGSCNVYFCNVGLNLTIDKMDAYAEYFGLGELTGVELPENTGVMSNRKQYLEAHGMAWMDGMSAQAAIGQADSKFTPIQLATYCATIANGGKRLETHFLDKITDYTGEKTVREYQTKELFDAGLSSDVLGVVREGMIQAAASGTASNVFGDYPVAVAAKTGTAETSEKVNGVTPTEENLSFICYAPANDPQIAVAVMLEYGKEGNYAKNVAKDILDQYFGYYTWDKDGNRFDQEGNQVDDEGKVIKTKEDLEKEKQQENAQKGETGSDVSSGVTSSEGASSGDASSESPRDDIPDSIFTGEPSSLPEGSGGEDGSSSPSSSPTSSGAGPDEDEGPVSPYYKGGG